MTGESSPVAPTIPWRRTAPLRWLWLVIILGAAVRIYLAWTAYVVSPDSAKYLAMARRMGSDWRGELGEDYPLGFPFLIRVAHAIFAPLLGANEIIAWQHAGQIVSLAFGIAAIPLVLAIGTRLFDAKCGLLAALIWAMLPSVAHSSADVLSDMPCLALMLASLTLIMRGLRKPAAVSLFFAGLLSGAAYTIRTEGGEPTFVAVLLLLTLPRFRFRRRLIGAGALMTGFTILGGTYILLEGGRIINKQSWAADSLSQRVGAIKNSDSPVSLPLATGGSGWGPQCSSSASSGLAGLNQVVPAALELIKSANDSVNTVWLVFAGLYFLVPIRRRVQKDELRAPLALWCLHTAVLIWLFMNAKYISGRHAFILDVGIVVFAAAFIVSVADGLRARGARPPMWTEAASVILIGAALSPWLLRELNRDRHYVREAGEWIAAQYAGQTLPPIITRDGRVPWYAGARRWMTAYSTKDVAQLPNAESAGLLTIPVDFDPPNDMMVVNGRPRRFIEDQHFMNRKGRKGVVVYRIENVQPVAERSAPP